MEQARLEYVEQLSYDVTALTELWGSQTRFRGAGFVGSAEPEAGDGAAGVALVLSKRAQKLVVESGCIGSRMAWVRLRGWDRDIFVVGIYAPYKYRTKPSQSDVLAQLDSLLQDLSPSLSVIVMDDFNAKLPRGIKDVTWPYSMHYKLDSGGQTLIDIMQRKHLFAASTAFQPKSRKRAYCQSYGNVTYQCGKANVNPTQIDHILV